MKHLLVWACAGFVLLLFGCNCMSGLGQDIQKAGHWLERKAEENK